MLALNKDIPVTSGIIGINDTNFLNKLNTCINKKCFDPGFGVKQLADMMDLGTTQLNRKVLSLTGYSPGKLLMYYRLNIARQLLEEEKETLKQIAWMCGFNGQTSFSRSFYNEYCCSPSQYREKYKLEHSARRLLWKVPMSADDMEQLLEFARQKPWLSELLMAVIANLGNETFTIKKLADSICISTSGLNRKIKETFDITPQKLIRDMKLQYARELLIEGHRSVAEVAYMAGFFDHAHFCHCFRSAFGCSPSVYSSGSHGKTSISWLKNKLMVQSDK